MAETATSTLEPVYIGRGAGAAEHPRPDAGAASPVPVADPRPATGTATDLATDLATDTARGHVMTFNGDRRRRQRGLLREELR